MTRILRILALSFLFAGRAFADCQFQDYAPGQVIDCTFDTKTGAGAGSTLGGTPVVSVYKGNSTTQSTAGVTLDVDFDGATGLNHVRVDTSADGTFYSAGSFFSIVVTTGTVSGTSIAPATVGGFTLGGSATYARLGAPAGASIAADIAAVPGASWDVSLASHVTAGTTGKKLGDIPTTSSSLTAAQVWDYLTTGWTTSGSAGAYFLSKLDLLTSGTRITIADPVQERTVSIVPGTAYTGTRQPKLTWPIAASTADLTGATPSLVVMDGDTVMLALTGTVTNAGSESQAVEFSATAAQTALLTRIGTSAYVYQLNAVWAADNPAAPRRLFRGDVNTDAAYNAGS